MKVDLFRKQYRERVVYVNGEWLPNYKATFSIYDRGFTNGYNIYEYTRTFKKKIWQLQEHINRGWQSLKVVRIDPGISKEKIAQLCMECLERNTHLLNEQEDIQIIFEITPGEYGLPHGRYEWELSEGEQSNATIIIKAEPLTPFLIPLAPFYTSGCNVVSTSIIQTPPHSRDPKIKTYSRLNQNLAEKEAELIDPEAFILMLDIHGNLAECTGESIWLVQDGVLKTPTQRNILRGVSRSNILYLAKKLNLNVVECNLQQWDLYNADEAFLTSTPYCMLPIGRYNGVSIGENVPGPITQQLLDTWSEWVGVDIKGQAEYLAKTYG
jgi:branched-chain amino acid aminotransferase